MSEGKSERQGRFGTKLNGAWHQNSLKKRIMVLTAFCVAFSTLAVGALSYTRIKSEALELAEVKLASEAHLLSERFSLDYHLIASDLETVAKTPPIQGLIRSLRNGGIDPDDGSTDTLWRSRLATIFQAVLSGRPDYFQFRYIGIDDAGRELVRIDRTRNGFSSVTGEALQQKRLEPYFKLAAEAPAGKVLFSKVTYNREHGQADGTGTPTLRGLYPIDDIDGNRFGFLAINVNYEKMLQSTFQDINPNRRTYVVNGGGDFMEHSGTVKQAFYRLEIRDAFTRAVPPIVQQVLQSETPEGLFFSEDRVAYFVREAGNFSQESASLGVIVEVPSAEFHATATKTRNEFLAAGFLVVLISTIVAVVAARSFMQPLADLSNAVRSSGSDELLSALPVERADEVGELAAAIRNRNIELVESRARFSAIVNNVVDGLILIDAYGRIEQFNPSCEKMFGYAQDEIIGQNVTLLMQGKDAENHGSYLERYRKGEGGHILGATRELEAIDKSGRVFPIELAISAVAADGETKFSGVIRDISQRKEVERMRKEFVSTVSHELRTPLTSIRGSLTLIDTMAPKDLPPKIGKLIGMARKNTERLILLVNDILDFEKLRAHKTQFALERVDLNEEMRKAADLNQGYADDAHISLVLDLNPQAVLVEVDPEKVQQVLANLISNAVKYSRPSGRVTLRTGLSGDQARIEVEDRGEGIPDNFRKLIFEPFSQADGSVTRKKGGTGLGLNISKELVEGMKGRIGFDSLEGYGTTFWVEFPRLAAEGPEQISLAPLFRPGRLKGLHLEDDRDFHVILQSGMDSNLDLMHARTIAEARDLLKKYQFDIVILDRLIADGDGLDLINSIPDPEATKIIVITAVDENVNHIHVDETLIKSKTPPGVFVERFSKVVEEVLARKGLDRKLA
ncbi:ATP-binding protein [Roseibium sp. Sym1]|uniref:ATP-binding protein n=1 Tax=Roseibium sp. Sym1 TaxID=3016006 RepID=UPI0022B5B69D|nr:ATP-binding protein [Roseibium sp. Sym1]